MKNKEPMITTSTKTTIIFCVCTLLFAALLFTFLFFFPVKMENPANGINEKIIAEQQNFSATIVTAGTTVTTAPVTSETTYSNTRKTTNRNRITTTVSTEAVWMTDVFIDPAYGFDQEFEENYYYEEPVIPDVTTAAPVITDIADITDAPDVPYEPIVTDAPPVFTDAPEADVPAVTQAPVLDNDYENGAFYE